MIERNERKAKTLATVFAIGLHLALAAFLYYQMEDSKPSQPEKAVKTSVKVAAAGTLVRSLDGVI